MESTSILNVNLSNSITPSIGSKILTTFSANKALKTINQQDIRLIKTNNFEASQIVLVEVLTNYSNKPIRLQDNSLTIPKQGDLIACTIGKNASFKIARVDIPTSANVTWVIINRGGITGQSIENSETSIPVKYIANLSVNNTLIKIPDTLPCATFNFDKQIIAVIGTETNSGKTTVSSKIIKELSQIGLKVGACKLTGICGDDVLSYYDAGANEVVDFSDCALASTIGDTQKSIEAAFKCISKLQQNNDIIVAEFGSSLLGAHPVLEILTALKFADVKLVICAFDSCGALGATTIVRSIGIEPIGISGITTNSSLACEVIQKSTLIQTFTLTDNFTNLLMRNTPNVELC